MSVYYTFYRSYGDTPADILRSICMYVCVYVHFYVCISTYVNSIVLF